MSFTRTDGKTEITPRERELLMAIEPVVFEFAKLSNPGTSDLDDVQPVTIHLTLGQLRRARAAFMDSLR